MTFSTLINLKSVIYYWEGYPTRKLKSKKLIVVFLQEMIPSVVCKQARHKMSCEL